MPGTDPVFACRDRHLIIEVDGESHTGRSPADRAKQQALESAGGALFE